MFSSLADFAHLGAGDEPGDVETPPPHLTGALSTQFNAEFSSPTTAGLGMLNLVLFG